MYPRTSLHRLRKTALAAVLGLAVIAPAPAAPAPRDAIIDPNSPAGTEYDLPLDRARDEANGGSVGGRGSLRGGGGSGSRGSRGSGGGGGAPANGGGTAGGSAGAPGSAPGGRAPLFGVGIASAGEAVDRGSGAAGPGRSGSGDASGGKGRSPRFGDGSPPAEAGEAARRDQEAAALAARPGETGSARTWLAALVAAILAAGGLVGLVIRRRMSPSNGAPSYLR